MENSCCSNLNWFYYDWVRISAWKYRILIIEACQDNSKYTFPRIPYYFRFYRIDCQKGRGIFVPSKFSTFRLGYDTQISNIIARRFQFYVKISRLHNFAQYIAEPHFIDFTTDIIVSAFLSIIGHGLVFTLSVLAIFYASSLRSQFEYTLFNRIIFSSISYVE